VCSSDLPLQSGSGRTAPLVTPPDPPAHPQATPTLPQAMTAPVDHFSPRGHGPVPTRCRGSGGGGRCGVGGGESWAQGKDKGHLFRLSSGMRSPVQAHRGPTGILSDLPSETPDAPVLNLHQFFSTFTNCPDAGISRSVRLIVASSHVEVT